MSEMAGERSIDERREGVGLEPRRILLVGLGTLGFLLISLAALMLYYRWAGTPHNDPAPPARFPEPRLQVNEAGDLAAFRARHLRELEGYGWEDPARGVFRIPVTRAAEILGARGAAGYAPLEAPAPGVPLPVRPQAAARPEAAGRGEAAR